jgi:hypothetical protein
MELFRLVASGEFDKSGVMEELCRITRHLGSGIILAGRTIWIADAHRDDGKRFVVRADELLIAFLELETAIHEFAASLVV